MGLNGDLRHSGSHINMDWSLVSLGTTRGRRNCGRLVAARALPWTPWFQPPGRRTRWGELSWEFKYLTCDSVSNLFAAAHPSIYESQAKHAFPRLLNLYTRFKCVHMLTQQNPLLSWQKLHCLNWALTLSCWSSQNEHSSYFPKVFSTLWKIWHCN